MPKRQTDDDLLEYLTEEEKETLANLLAALPAWEPDPRNHPQCQAYETSAFETLYGGAAGGGKSDLILGLARNSHRKSLLLRREFPDLERSLISRSQEFYGDREHYNQSKHVWKFTEKMIDRVIEFGHMERVGTPQQQGDEAQYAGAAYDFIGWDQLEQFPEYAYLYMFSRARSTNKRQRVRIVATANPVGEFVEWIFRRWGPWLDETHPKPAKPGEIRYYKRNDEGVEVETSKNDPDGVSRTYIPAGLQDNPYLGEDYRRLLNLMPEPMRTALMKGLWSVMMTDDAYQVIPRAWVKAAMRRWVDEPPTIKVKKADGSVVNSIPPLMIGADIARGGDDKTVLAPRRGNWYSTLRKFEGRTTPTGDAVADLLAIELRNGGMANLDVIGIGASAYDISRQRGLPVKAVNFSNKSTATDRSGTLRFVNMRAQFYWSFREALDPESGLNVQLPPDPELEGDLCSPRWIPQSNGIRIEEKEKIRDRIGRSPDCSDAVVLAWTSSGVPEEEIERLGSNEIDFANIPPDQVEFARQSGVDVDALMGKKRK